MADDFDRAMAALQEQVLQDARNYFSAQVIEEFSHPQNEGLMLEPDGLGRAVGLCGDTMEIYLRLAGPRIAKAAFITDGCGVTVACGSMLTRMAGGLLLAEAAAITPEALTAALDGLPEDHAHCAVLAVQTLRAAIAACSGPAGTSPPPSPGGEAGMQEQPDNNRERGGPTTAPSQLPEKHD